MYSGRIVSTLKLNMAYARQRPDEIKEKEAISVGAGVRVYHCRFKQQPFSSGIL